jgi:hypothetical protein
MSVSIYLVRWRGGPVKRSGAMTRQRTWPMAETDAGAISVPTLDPARGPAPLVSCRKPCAAGDARGGGRPQGRHRPPVTTRVDRCRHTVTVSTIVVSTLPAPPSPTRASPPPAVRSRLPCAQYPVQARGSSPLGIGCAFVRYAGGGGEPPAGAASGETPASGSAVSRTVPDDDRDIRRVGAARWPARQGPRTRAAGSARRPPFGGRRGQVRGQPG